MSSGSRFVLIARLLVMAVMADAAFADLPPEPEDVAHKFYAALGSSERGIFEQQRKALSPLLSQNLNRLIVDALRAAAEYQRKNPTDKGTMVDGSCFFYGGRECSFTSYKIVRVARTSGKANVTVLLALVDQWTDATWENVLEMKQEGGKWVIDDVAHGNDKASLYLIQSIRYAQ